MGLLAASLVGEWFRTDFTVVSYSFPNVLARITHRKLQGLRPYLSLEYALSDCASGVMYKIV